MPYRRILYFVLLVFSGMSAQHATLSGRVTDARTGEPLVSVNVFFTNTTIGASTGPEGQYRIENVPPGSYELVAAIIGYEHRQMMVRPAAGDQMEQDFALTPRVYKSTEVQVEGSRAEHKAWQRNYKRFQQEFLGATLNASQCHILNPEVLDFQKDPSGILLATAEAPLEIMNYALGYKALVILLYFSYTDQSFSCRFTAQFTELTSPQRDAEWAEKRREAYRGSFRHFLNVLHDGQLNETRFSISATRGTGREYTRHPFLSPKWQAQLISPAADSRECRLHFPFTLEVYFDGERDELTGRKYQLSYLTLSSDTVTVSLNGYTPHTVLRFGRWGNERFADMLPLDYQPLASD